MPLSLLAHTDRPRSSKDVRTWHSGGLSVTRFVSISHPTSKLRPRSILDDSTLVLALSPGEPTGDFRATPQRGFHEVDVGFYPIYSDRFLFFLCFVIPATSGRRILLGAGASFSKFCARSI